MDEEEGLNEEELKSFREFKERLKKYKEQMGNLQDWNKKIYRDESGDFVKGNLGAEEFWEEFGIKSGPKFREACWSHIPSKWADDVRLMLKQVQDELDDRISFRQIKEKFCWLTVYYDAKDEEAKTRMDELIVECQDRLGAKDLHPKKG